MEEVDEIARRPNSIPISCQLKLNMDGLLCRIWDMMALVRAHACAGSYGAVAALLALAACARHVRGTCAADLMGRCAAYGAQHCCIWGTAVLHGVSPLLLLLHVECA